MEPKKQEIDAVRGLLVAFFGFSVAGFFIGILVGNHMPSSVELSNQDRFQFEAMLLLNKKRSQAELLVEEGRHLEAARAFINLAGAERILSTSKQTTHNYNCPTIDERVALQQLTSLQHGKIYSELLEILYSECEDKNLRGAND